MTARFGDFELDAAGYRLTRYGQDIRVAKQPMDLLILLVTRHGELITREEISEALWGNPGFVGAEHSINTTIRRLRVALEDDPGSPTYVETVPRRGYRFVAPVSHLGNEPVAARNAPAQEFPAPPPAVVGLSRPIGIASRPLLALAITLGLVLAAAMVALIRANSRGPGSPPQLSWKPITKAIHPVGEIASDGRSVFWTEYGETGSQPWQAPVDGSMDAKPIHTPFPSALVLDATREGQLLLVARGICRGISNRGCEGPIYELTLSSGQVSRLGGITGMYAALSPNGSRVAFTHWNELWLANRDGSEPRRIAELPGGIDPIRWSPDGRLLRFTNHYHAESGNPLWEADAAGGKTRLVLPEWSKGSEPLSGAWMPDGAFVFGVERPAGTDLWRLMPAGWPTSWMGRHRLQQITRGPLDFFGPAAIPGRAELAVIGARKQGELVHFDQKTATFRPLLNGISAEMADFSRDGKWVAYVTYPEHDLWRSRIDGSEALQLTHDPLNAGMPRISPDTSQVAFTGDYSGKRLRTWLVPFDGGEPRPATRLAEGTAEVAPTWSPDGTRLLFRFDPPGQRNVLQILDLRSGSIETVPKSEDRFNQRWSPDGKWIAATPNDEKGLDIFDLERREWTNLTQMRADDPNWSSNGDWIYFCTRSENDEEAIYRVSLSSRKAERVTSLAGTPRAFNEIYTQWVGLAPDDSPVLLRSADLRQIYLLSFGSK